MTLPNLIDDSISSKVVRVVREAIQSGEFAPGQRLVERTLASQLGVSHIPVREALTRLADEGLVQRTPRRGARVAVLTREDLLEISSLRIVLEQFVCHRVQAVWSDTIETQLREIVDSMVAASKRGDVSQVFMLDQLFHESLWEFADHKLLLEIASQLRGRINGFLLAANRSLASQDLMDHAATHYNLIHALASGDASRANEEMSSHIQIASDRISVAQDAPS